MKYCFVFLCCWFLLAPCISKAAGNERITQFHSDIRIDTTGRVEVGEHITVYADGNEIKRGIVRRIPLYRKEDKVWGAEEKRIDIHVLSVTRDGKDEPFHMQEESGHLVVYVGSKEYILPSGEYRYAIRYESYGHVGFFDEYDELYWNVTGDQWSFVIERASVTFYLPKGLTPLQSSCYTGASGSSESLCRQLESAQGTAAYETTGPLAPGEGFTVAVAFPRDVIDRSTMTGVAKKEVSDALKLLYASIGLLLAGWFFSYTWRKVGKDPEKQVVIPQFKPPHGWSPAMVRYLYQRDCDDRAFSSAILSMAVKRFLKVDQEKKKYVLEKNDVEKEEKLSPEEKSIYSILFKTNKRLEVANKNHAKFSSAIAELKKSLYSQENLKDYFLHNGMYIAKAAGLVLVLLTVYFLAIGLSFGELLLMIPFLVISAFIISMAIRSRGCIILIALLVGIGFLLGTSFIMICFLGVDILSLLYVFLLLSSFFLYVYLIKAPTVLGAKTKAELEGFRMYLRTAEGDRLNALTPPERTPELFEELLPYAVALNVENEWSKRFNSILEAAGYQPDWYSSSAPVTNGILISSLGNSLTSSIKSASVDPTPSSSSGSGSWSSGSSGGGWSGGGGGGGGGGGW